jgi:hypothetical protein
MFKRIAIAPLTALVLAPLIAPSVHAQTCIKLDYDNSPAVKVKGHIIPARKLKVSSDMRAAKGPYIRLKDPLHIDTGSGCETWREIPVHGDRIGPNRPVTITGTLIRPGSALAKPPVFIQAETIK